MAHLQAHRRSGLFMDMGLGKTAVVLKALQPEHLPALVVAPKRVAKEVWPLEQELWRPDLSLTHAAASSPAARRSLLTEKSAITVLGVDNLKDALEREDWRTLVIDESSRMKNHRSQRFRAARRLAYRIPHVWLLSGTPSPEGLMDLWSQIGLLDGGARLGKTITGFRSRYFQVGTFRSGRPAILPNGVVASWVPKPGAADEIHSLIEDICLSMGTDGRLNLPPLSINKVTVPLTPEVKRHYKKFKKELVVDLDFLGVPTHSAASAGVLTAKLSQMVAGFLYNDAQDGTYVRLHSERVNAVAEVVEGTGSPVLVFYRFKAELEMLRSAIPEAVHIDDHPDVVRDWNLGKVPVLLAHPASASHGLNLQYGGHTIVWSSLTWSLEEWEQANKRLLRSGQEHPVVVHVPVSPRSVDEAILDALIEKRSVQDALLEHLESPL